MKVKMELVANPALFVALSKIKNMNLPLKTLYKLRTFFDPYQNERKKFTELYEAELSKVTEKDADGNPIMLAEGIVKLQEGKKVELNKALDELNNLEVELPNFPMKLEDLPEDQLKLSLAELEVISDLFKAQEASDKAAKEAAEAEARKVS